MKLLRYLQDEDSETMDRIGCLYLILIFGIIITIGIILTMQLEG